MVIQINLKKILIENLNNIKLINDDYLFHAGTRFDEGKFYSNGGRVLNFVSIDQDFENARNRAVNLIKNLIGKMDIIEKTLDIKSSKKMRIISGIAKGKNNHSY